MTFLILARYFSVAEIGIYTFLIGIATLISVFSNCGTNEFLFREGAASPEKLHKLLKASRLIRALLGLSAGILVLLGLYFWQQSVQYAVTFLIILLFTLVEAQTTTYIMAYRSRGITSFEAWFLTLRNTSRLALVFVLCVLKRNFLEIMAGLLVISLLGLWLADYCRNHYIGTTDDDSINLGFVLENLKYATPFLLLNIITMGYSKADQIMLGFMANNHDVGIYGVSFQIYTIALFVPSALNVAITPKWVNLFTNNIKEWKKDIIKTIKYIFPISIILGVSLYLFLPYFIIFAFGSKYEDAQDIIRILMLSFAFSFIWASVITGSLISSNDMKLFNFILIFTLGGNVILNYFLIPYYGPRGAAYANLCSEIFGFSLGGLWLWHKCRKLAIQESS
ncbi:MAG: flippase [Candidatus Helarchaeota archaeon]|nr:flippase [Candidatus Helarchaeota archaeon]